MTTKNPVTHPDTPLTMSKRAVLEEETSSAEETPIKTGKAPAKAAKAPAKAQMASESSSDSDLVPAAKATVSRGKKKTATKKTTKKKTAAKRKKADSDEDEDEDEDEGTPKKKKKEKLVDSEGEELTDLGSDAGDSDELRPTELENVKASSRSSIPKAFRVKSSGRAAPVMLFKEEADVPDVPVPVAAKETDSDDELRAPPTKKGKKKTTAVQMVDSDEDVPVPKKPVKAKAGSASAPSAQDRLGVCEGGEKYDQVDDWSLYRLTDEEKAMKKKPYKLFNDPTWRTKLCRRDETPFFFNGEEIRLGDVGSDDRKAAARAKYAQNPSLLDILSDTKDAILVDTSGAPMKWMMELREEMKSLSDEQLAEITSQHTPKAPETKKASKAPAPAAAEPKPKAKAAPAAAAEPVVSSSNGPHVDIDKLEEAYMEYVDAFNAASSDEREMMSAFRVSTKTENGLKRSIRIKHHADHVSAEIIDSHNQKMLRKVMYYDQKNGQPYIRTQSRDNLWAEVTW